MHDFQHLHHLNRLANIDDLIKSTIESNAFSIIQNWADAAGEHEPNKRSEINYYRTAYAERSLDKNTSKLLEYIESVMDVLSTDEVRTKVIRTQGIGDKKELNV